MFKYIIFFLIVSLNNLFHFDFDTNSSNKTESNTNIFLFCFLGRLISTMARGCICCVKYMLFLFNLLFWVSVPYTLYQNQNMNHRMSQSEHGVFTFPLCVCVTVRWVWPVGCRSLALGLPGQLCDAVSFLPFALCRQPHHHPGHHRHGDRLPGMFGCHQGEQVSAAECE